MAAFPLVFIELVQMTQYGRRRRSSVDCHCHDNHHCHTTTSLLPGSLLHLQVRSTGPTIKETEVMWLGSFWAHPKPLSVVSLSPRLTTKRVNLAISFMIWGSNSITFVHPFWDHLTGGHVPFGHLDSWEASQAQFQTSSLASLWMVPAFNMGNQNMYSLKFKPR